MRPNPPLYNPTEAETNSAAAAAAAATAGGAWKQAAFDGSGIPEGSKDDFETQFRAAHTGMVYTPPLFSDHIAVSLLLQPGALALPSSEVPRCQDSASRRAQPYRKQRRLQDMFAARPARKPGAATTNGAAAPAAASAAPSAASTGAGGAVARAPATAAKGGLDRWVQRGGASAAPAQGAGGAGKRSRQEEEEQRQLQRALEVSRKEAAGGAAPAGAKKKKKKGGIMAFFSVAKG